jgi:F-type H+-transporting ATPase subunit delta
VTTSLISLVVGTGRASELPAIIKSLVERSASENRKVVAEVRSAVALSDDQITRLATALNTATGLDVEVKVIIDGSVLGGLLTQIGDTVIDGTVRSKLGKLRESMA